MADERLLTERRAGVEIITINQPERRNALDMTVREFFHDALAAAIADPTCRVIIVTGAGGHFCAGGDLASMSGVTAVAGRERLRRLNRLALLIAGASQPVIAAVEGASAGAGFGLAMACDIVVASRTAKFHCPFNRLGLAPDLGLSWSLPARLGLGRARLLMLAGRTTDAVEGERIGLVEVLSEPGGALDAALAIAGEIEAGAPLANAAVKALLRRAPQSQQAQLDAEADLQAGLFTSEDLAEGLAAFAEKRPPVFSGR